jgi:hypothetical protein
VATACVAPAARAQSNSVRNIVCATGLLDALVVPPFGSDSEFANCSEILGYGVGAWRGGSTGSGAPPGPLSFGTLTITKPRDVNSVKLAESMYFQTGLANLRIYSLRQVDAHNWGIESQVVVRDVYIFAMRGSVLASGSFDVIEVRGRRYALRGWNPAAAPGTQPSYEFCRDLVTQLPTCP